MSPIGRREFLRVGMAAGAATLVGGTMDATPASAAARPGWATLAASLTGSLVLPNAASYGTDAQLYNEVFTPAPAAIAYCASATDVQRCVMFAREHKVKLAARSGGHSYGGYSSTPGLVIDVSALDQVTLGAGNTRAVVGAGTQLLPLYSQLGASGVLVPGGSCPTVGIAGLALGGGIGVLGRAYGMTCDHMESVTVVTADGVRRVCTPSQHSDLYWACRGGGGGNFGVVTSFTFRVDPIPPVTLFTLEWPWSEAALVLDAWLRWIPATPDELWANCQLSSGGPSGVGTLRVTGVFAGTTAACASALAPLLSAVGVAPSYRFVGPEDYLRAMLIEAGCEHRTVGECNLPTRSATGTLPRSAFIAKSTYVNAPLSSAGTTAVIEAVQSLGTEVPGVGGGIVLDGYGGAISRVPADATAFVHRSAIACAQYSVSFGSGNPGAAVVAGSRAWLHATQGALAPFARGAYQNYIDPTLPNWAEAYYGSNLPRLMRIKRRYDPDDVFRFAQSIPRAT
jgi:FAD/FMN-containing dehydrogenase